MQNEILELRHTVDSLRDQVAAVAAGSSQQYQPPSRSGMAARAVRRPAHRADMTAQLVWTGCRTLEDSGPRPAKGAERRAAQQAADQQNADLTKQIGDLGFRVQALEGGKGSALGTAGPAASARQLTAARGCSAPRPMRQRRRRHPPHRRELANLQQGFAALARRDYRRRNRRREDWAGQPPFAQGL